MSMPNYRRRFWLIIWAFATFSVALVLLSFYSRSLLYVEPYRILYIGLACACILPLFFFPLIAKRSPRSSVGLVVLGASAVLYALYTVAHLIFSLSGLWLERVFDLGELLNILACVIFIWLGFRSSREKPERGQFNQLGWKSLNSDIHNQRDSPARIDAFRTDDKARTRQFWLRTILVVGILWGFLPLVMAPFITKGAHDTTYDIAASILNSLTILPACALAFWHRRIACIWLSVNAIVLAGALATFIQRTRKLDSTMIAEVAGPVLFAVLLDWIEARRWPAAVEKRPAKARRAEN